MKWFVLMLATVTTLGWVSPALADPINVSYTVTGSTGDWTLDFSVTNNLSGAPNQNLYYWGVALDNNNAPTTGPANFAGYASGASNFWYDQNYVDGLQLPGTTTTGFDVTSSDAVAPTSVNWFAYTVDTGFAASYTAGGNLDGDATNPLFEGVSSSPSPDPAPVPEPASVVLLGSGLVFAAKRVRRGTCCPSSKALA